MSPIADGLGGERGFVGGTKDATGLAGIGARDCDSAFQRFITVDPIQNLADPRQSPDSQYYYDSLTALSDG